MTEEEAADVPADAPGERYSINRVQIISGKPVDPSKYELAANYLTKLPVLPNKAAAYVPMPYTFRVRAESKRIKLNNLFGRAPPFHLLLDHTIAVIWLLFTKKEDFNCSLGIAQLQWALLFLQTIVNRQGEHPQDVQLCINAIENILVGQYAELSKEISELNKLDGNVQYIDGALGSHAMISQTLPFSLNYSEMKDKIPPEIIAPPKDTEKKPSITSTEAQEQLEAIKTSAGVEAMENLDSVSKHKAVNILKSWKEQQMEKIRGELKRLRSIEDKMANIDEEFSGYTEDDLEKLVKK